MGYRFETPVVVLAALTLLLSVLSQLGLLEALVLSADGLAAGQVWRVFTWFLVALDPLSLIFGIYCLLVFGNDLSRSLGVAEFLRLAIGIPVAAGLLVCLPILALGPGLGRLPILGNLVVLEILTITWAIVFPGRQILLFLLFPVGGRNLIAATVGITLLYAVYGGAWLAIPQFLGQGMTYAYLNRASMLWWLRNRFRPPSRPVSRRTHRRAVRRDEVEEPPKWLH